MTDDFVLTTCPYCGCGCNFYLVAVNGNIVDVAPCFTDRISQGKLCIKGRRAHEFIDSEHRLTKPLIRKNGQLKETSWDEALDFIAKGLSDIKSQAGPDAIGLLSSAKCTNEENYLMMKLARAVIGTNNVDHGASCLSAFTSILKVSGSESELPEEEIEKPMAKMRDPLGTFYRFTFPKSLLQRVVKET